MWSLLYIPTVLTQAATAIKMRSSGQTEKLDTIKRAVLCCSIKVKVVYRLDSTHFLLPLKALSMVRSSDHGKKIRPNQIMILVAGVSTVGIGVTTPCQTPIGTRLYRCSADLFVFAQFASVLVNSMN